MRHFQDAFLLCAFVADQQACLLECLQQVVYARRHVGPTGLPAHVLPFLVDIHHLPKGLAQVPPDLLGEPDRFSINRARPSFLHIRPQHTFGGLLDGPLQAAEILVIRHLQHVILAVLFPQFAQGESQQRQGIRTLGVVHHLLHQTRL